MIGRMLQYHLSDRTVTLHFENGQVQIQFLHDGCFRVFSARKSSGGFSRAISQPVIDAQLSVQVTKLEDDSLRIDTNQLQLIIHPGFLIDVYNSEGTLLCADYRQSRAPFRRRGNSELAKEEGHAVLEEARRYSLEIVKQLNGDEAFYGLGERPGHLNKRGCFYRNWNTDDPSPHVESFEALYKSIPFFITLTSQKAFGIFFDNTYQTYFDFGKENENYYYFAANDGNLDYYFMYGPEITTVLRHYTNLTGTTPLPQKWTLGYQQCRWSYPSAARVREVAAEFRKRNIPCDVLYLDIDYMNGYRVFTWNETTFPNPAAFIQEMAAEGFKIVTIIDPGVKKDAGYTVYDEGLAAGYYATDADGVTYVNRVWPGDSVYPDFTEERVRRWWGGLHRSLLDAGVAGIWTDMNEPASFNGPLPDDVQFKNDGVPTDHREAHNVYGSLMAKATYDGVREFTGKRPFVITRACYAGTQKYSTIWTGDNHSFWEHLRMSIPMLSNLGLSGLSFAGTDVGGFSFDCTGELLSRWVQVGAFTPLFRNHSAANTRDQEPWAFDTLTEEINRKYIKLRYRFISYLYDQFWKGEQTGLPIIRPLLLHHQDDVETHQLNDQFYCGDSILIAPVVQQGKTWRHVYLPEGGWYDYWSKRYFAGRQHILYHAPLDVCPIFVKEGSTLPVDPPQQYVGEMESDTLMLELYPLKSEGATEYNHIEDDGQTYAYQNGVMNGWRVSTSYLQGGTGGLRVRIQQTVDGMPSKYRLLKLSIMSTGISKVECNDREIPFNVSESDATCSIAWSNHKLTEWLIWYS